jgi:hypothetical protein
VRRFLLSIPGILILGTGLLFAARADLEILTADLPPAIVGRPYNPEPLIVGGGGACPMNNPSFRILWGDLPAGVRLSAAGYFSGVPRRTGTYPLLIQAASDCARVRREFTLTVGAAPILFLTPAELTIRYRAGGPPPASGTLLVTSSWGDLAYAVDASGADWLSLRPLNGRTPVPGSALTGDPVQVAADPNKLKPGTYRAFVRASAWESLNQPLATVTLIVE